MLVRITLDVNASKAPQCDAIRRKIMLYYGGSLWAKAEAFLSLKKIVFNRRHVYAALNQAQNLHNGKTSFKRNNDAKYIFNSNVLQ